MGRIMDLATHPDRFVLVSELAEYWRVSERTIYRDIEKGALIAVRVGSGGQLRVPIAAAREYGRPHEAAPVQTIATPPPLGDTAPPTP